MIKFNNYPPQKAGDIELTPGALRVISQVGAEARGERLRRGNANILHAYGQSVMHCVLSAVDGDSELAFRIINPVVEQVDEVVSAQSIQFQAGLIYAKDIALNAEGVNR